MTEQPTTPGRIQQALMPVTIRVLTFVFKVKTAAGALRTRVRRGDPQ